MKNIVFVFTALLLYSCTTDRYAKFSYQNSKTPWIDDFKDQVFFNCLRESYKGDSIFKMIEKKDALNPYDGLSPDAIQKTREVAKKFVTNMPPPAMCDGCTKGMNYYMAQSLHYYISKDLDDIARKEYQKFVYYDKKFNRNLKR